MYRRIVFAAPGLLGGGLAIGTLVYIISSANTPTGLLCAANPSAAPICTATIIAFWIGVVCLGVGFVLGLNYMYRSKEKPIGRVPRDLSARDVQGERMRQVAGLLGVPFLLGLLGLIFVDVLVGIRASLEGQNGVGGLLVVIGYIVLWAGVMSLLARRLRKVAVKIKEGSETEKAA